MVRVGGGVLVVGEVGGVGGVGGVGRVEGVGGGRGGEGGGAAITMCQKSAHYV